MTERAAKRAMILDAARRVFEAEGLDGASLRAIAAEAGYTPPALYFHFASKEDLYAAVLHASLERLGTAVAEAAAAERDWAGRLHAAAMAFFRFYAQHPRDLDLGFYLLRGGMKPAGLGRARDEALNAALADVLAPIGDAARASGLSAEAAEVLVADLFAHAAGLLLLAHTGRIRMFGASAEAMMDAHVRRQVGHLRDGT